MGGGKGGGGTSTQYSGVQIPQEVMARYKTATDRAENVSNTPWSNYGGEFVAPVNATQQGGYNTMEGGKGYTDWGFQAPNQSLQTGVQQAQPLLNQASGSINTGQVQGEALTAAGLGQASEAYRGAQPFNATAGQAYGNAYGAAQPYNAAATAAAGLGMASVNPNALNLDQFYNPYQSQVTQATMAQLNQQQEQQRNDQRGNMIREGSWGGDRGGIANANLVNQQNLATGSTIGNLNLQNYNQALAAAQQQQGVGLGAAQANRAAIQQGAGQLLGIGQQGYQQGMGLGQAVQGLGQQQYQQGMGQAGFTTQAGQQLYGQGVGAGQAQAALGQANYGMYGDVAAKQAALAGQAYGQNMQTAQGEMGFGTMQQQTQQAQDSALYNQWLQEQGYPYQASQFYTNAVMGTGPLSGSSSYSGAFTPQPFFSDERLKENIQTIGHTHDHIPIIRFNYKGDNRTQIGLSAQDVQKHHPEAVGSSHGYKTVDYAAATDSSARPHRALGGQLPPGVGVLGVTPTIPTAGPTGLGDIVARQKAMFGANAPGSGPGAPLGLPSQAGISTPGAPPPGAGAPARPGDATSPVLAGLAEAGPRAVPSYIDPGGSANGATGDGTGSATGEAGSVGAGVGTAAGTAGATATDSAGQNSEGPGPGSEGVGGAAAAADAGAGEAWAAGGRVGYAKGSKVDRADGYAGGFGDLDSIMNAQAAMYGTAPWAQKAAAGTGSIIPQLQVAKASPLIKPPEQKAPAQPQQTGAQQGMGGINDAVKTAESLDKAYGLGKDVLVGSPEKGTPAVPGVGKPNDPNYVKAVPASADYKPATGGLHGYGGKWGAEAPPETRPATTPAPATTTPAPSPAATAPPTAPSPNPAATTLPAAPPTAAPVQTSDATNATKDLGSATTDVASLGDTGSLTDALALADTGAGLGDAGAGLEAGSELADVGTLAEDVPMFARKGGRIGYSGVDKDSSSVPFSGTSILPEGVYDPEDPSKPIEPPKSDEKSGSGKSGSSGVGKGAGTMAGMAAGAAIGSIVPGIGTLVGAGLGGTLGGAAGSMFASGGAVSNDNEGLGAATGTFGVFSRSQGHKLVDRAPSRPHALRLVKQHGPDDHFVKPIAPGRAFGGRAGYEDGGEPELTEEQKAARVEREALEARQAQEAQALGAAKVEPVVEPTPAAREMLKGIETAQAQPAPGLAAAEQQVAGLSTAPVVPRADLGKANENITPVQAAPPPPPQPPTEEPKPAPPGAGGGTPAGLPSYPVPAGERRLVGEIYYTSNGDGTWMPDQPTVKPPTETPKPATPTQTPQQATPTTRGGNSYNIGNVKTFDGKDTFQAPPTFDDGVALTVSNASSYAGKYNNGKPMTIAEIGARWAPPGSKDDPNNLNANWPKNVAAAYKAAGFDPNVPVDFSNPQQAAAFAKAVHQAEHGTSLDITAYLPGVAKAGDPAVRKGFASLGGGGVGDASTTATASTEPVPTDTGLGGASPEAKSLWGQSKDWVDRNESWGVPLLTGIGAMLSSPSRTLAGSIGTGLVAGGTQYGTLGQRQQGIDIQKQTQNISQAGKIAEAMTNIQRERSGVLAANPHADVSQYDKIYNNMRNKYLELVGMKGAGISTTPGSYTDYLKTQSPAMQAFSNQVAPRDDFVALYQNAMTTQDPTERAARMREADAALERARTGQAVGKNGQALGVTPELTQAVLEFERRKQAAANQGGQGVLDKAVEVANQELEAYRKRFEGRTMSADEQKEFRRLTEVHDAALRAKAAGPSTRARGGGVWREGWWKGGRIAKQDAGAVTGEGDETEPRQPDIQLAQYRPEPPPRPSGAAPRAPLPAAPAAPAEPPKERPVGVDATSFAHDPEAMRAEARRAADANMPDVADELNKRAAALEAQWKSSGQKTVVDKETGEIKVVPTPGSIQTGIAKELEDRRVENNLKVDYRLQQLAQDNALAEQQLQKMRELFIDKDGNPRLTTGPASEKLSQIGSWMEQAGMDPSIIYQLANTNAADAQAIKKLSEQLNAQLGRGAYGARPTEQQSEGYKNTIPNIGMHAATIKHLLDDILIPQAQFNRDLHKNVIQGKDPATVNYGHELTNYFTKNPQFSNRTMPTAEERTKATEKALPFEVDKTKRQPGKVYTNDHGERQRWTGTGWVDP